MRRELVLRPDYQTPAVEAVRDAYRRGKKRVLLVLPTGGGKSVIAAYLMRAAADKGSRTSFLVDRVNLVDQISTLLDDYGIDHGVVQAGHWRRRDTEILQVCSVQTLEKRGFFPDTKFLVVDEAHCTRKQTTELLKSGADIRALGLTATPFTQGMAEVYDELVNVTTTNWLIENGFLVPLKTYAAVRPDMKGAKVVAGEWTNDEIEKRGHAILGKIVDEWIAKTDEHFGGPVKTIVFAASVAHGAELAEAFNNAGHNFQQLSYLDKDDDERREKIAEFRKPDSDIRGLIACEVLTKGFDVPDVLCGILARPYRKSFSSHIQQLGRLMRPSAGKDFALCLDHCGNTMRFLKDQQDLFANGVESLKSAEKMDSKPRKEEETDGTEKAVKCPACQFVMPPRAMVCPACGHQKPRVSMHESGEGAMVLINGKAQAATGKYAFLSDREKVWSQLAFMALRKKPNDPALAQKWAVANFRDFYGEFPPRGYDVQRAALQQPSAEMMGQIQYREMKWRKTLAKTA